MKGEWFMETKKKQSSIADRILPAILMGAALSVGGILYVPYTFYVPFQTVFGLTNTQIGTLTAAYASLAVPGYLVGGVLGDKFNAKILTVIAVISTSLLSLWMATIPGYKTLLLIYFHPRSSPLDLTDQMCAAAGQQRGAGAFERNRRHDGQHSLRSCFHRICNLPGRPSCHKDGNARAADFLWPVIPGRWYRDYFLL